MQKLFVALLMMTSVSASADVIQCNFTEPFFNLVIDTDAKTLTQIEPNWEENASDVVTTVLSTNVKVAKISSRKVSSVVEFPRYQVFADGKKVLVLELNYKGSDGMSDFAYPYDTQYGPNYGGCSSDKVPRLNFLYEEYYQEEPVG